MKVPHLNLLSLIPYRNLYMVRPKRKRPSNLLTKQESILMKSRREERKWFNKDSKRCTSINQLIHSPVSSLSFSKQEPAQCIHQCLNSIIYHFSYIFFSWIWTDYTYAFIFTTILAAFDFYTVKNITGRFFRQENIILIPYRLLMGLRWWVYNAADGNEHWIFESRDTEYKAHKVDYICFWGAMVLGFLFWSLFGFMNVLGLRPAWVRI